MKRKYQVRWYEYNLTNERSRKFFTEWGAVLFVYYIGKWQNAKARISGI